MSRTAWCGALATVALLLVFGRASAAADATTCLPVSGGGALTVEGLGRVVFAELTTDRVRDAATFGGRVCLAIEGTEVVFRTERLEAAGLGGPLTLEASGVSVDVPGWSLEAAGLHGGHGWAELTEVAIVGADAIGYADSMRFEFDSGVLVATRLRLVTSSLRLDATSAALEGDVLVAEGARVSSCDCPPAEAPLRVDAERVRLDLTPEVAVVVAGGMIVAGGVRWPLPNPIVLDEAALADLVFPFAVGPDPDRDGAFRVGVLMRDVAPGVRMATAWSSGVAGSPARAGFEVAAERPGVALRWIGGTDRWSVDVRTGTALADGWRIDARQRFEAGAIEEPMRDASVRLGHGAATTVASGRWTSRFGVSAALTGQTLAGVDIAGPRLGVDGRLTWTGPTGVVVPGLEVAGATTAYPGVGAPQTWASVHPSVVVRAGTVRAEVVHLARWVVGASPFGVRVDRVTALHRTDAAASWSGPIGRDALLGLEGTLRYGWDADPVRAGHRLGFEDLTLRARATFALDAAALRVDVGLALAGSIDPRPGRDAFATVRFTWTRGLWEAGVRSTVGFAPTVAWRDLTVFAAVPFDATPAWSLRPYLAVDVLAFAGGAGPWLRGHGLDVGWHTCCGTVEFGYRSDTVDGATTHFAVLLPVRPLDPARLTAGAAAP